MSVFPIAWLISVLMAFAAYVLAWNTRVPGRTRFFLCSFLLCLVAITLLLGMRVYFDWLWPARVQPFVAILVVPSAWLGFAALMQDNRQHWNRIVLHNGVLVGAALLGIAAPVPVSADVFILAINGIYLVRLSALLRYGPDDFSAVPTHATSLWRAAIYATIALTGLMVATDGLVFAVSLGAGDPHIMRLLTGASGLLAGFVLVVALVAVPLLLGAPRSSISSRAEPSDADRHLMQALDALMKEKQLFRDSNLTLARLAKRLSVSTRDLSGATNRVKAENFSRLINSYRIAYAQKALVETDLPVTEVMFEAGFLSKSSFNTEFRRVTGLTPSQFRTRGAVAEPARAPVPEG
jgi:AraC-like DNA-binding protein